MSLLINLPAPQTPPIPAFDTTAVLDGVTYTLRFQWNDSDAAWYLRVLDEPGQVVLMGDWRLVSDWPLYHSRVKGTRFPPGWLMVSDTTGQGTDPDLMNLGASHQLVYLTAAESDALGIPA